jgi:hypothetical protein
MWWWCHKHGTVEAAAAKCGSLDRLGPYETPEAARAWRERAEMRNEQWEAEDEEWDERGA